MGLNLFRHHVVARPELSRRTVAAILGLIQLERCVQTGALSAVRVRHVWQYSIASSLFRSRHVTRVRKIK